MTKRGPTLGEILIKSMVVHTLTYFCVGLLAFTFFDYSAKFADPAISCLMRQTNDPWVMAGVLFQPIRGLLFGGVFYLLRDIVFARRHGWLVMWINLIVVGIISTFGPSPGSLEGLIYTKLAFSSLWGGMLEVLCQSLLLAGLVSYWVNHPDNRWLGGVLWVGFALAMALPALGLVVSLSSS